MVTFCLLMTFTNIKVRVMKCICDNNSEVFLSNDLYVFIHKHNLC